MKAMKFIFVSHLECSSKLFRVDFHPKFTSRKHDFTRPCTQKESTFGYVLNDLKLLNVRLHDLDMTLSGELEKPLKESLTFKVSLITITVMINETCLTLTSQFVL